MKVAGDTYEVVFPKMSCTMLFAHGSDDELNDGPELSCRQVMFLPFKLIINWFLLCAILVYLVSLSFSHAK